MSIYVLKAYVEKCFKSGISPRFEGLRNYYKENIL